MKEKFLVEGKYRNVIITFSTTSYETAVRGAKQVLKENRSLDAISVKDHKGNVLRVIKRSENERRE